MRFLVKISLPTKLSSEMIKSGEFMRKFERIAEELKPEAVYATEMDGCRTIILIVALAEANHMIKVAEPFFMGFDAKVEFHPIMSLEEVGQGLSYTEFAAKLG